VSHPIFDGHNDLLLRLMQRCHTSHLDDVVQQCLTGDGQGHIDVPRMQRGGFIGGLFAVFVPPSDSLNFSSMGTQGYCLPMPDPMPYEEAFPVASSQIATLLRLIENSNGQMRLCTSYDALKDCVASNVIAAVLHMEGAEAIDEDLHALDVFYAAGLRSLGPVWSRNTIFAEGVPLKYPATPDIGGGLTEAGRRLVAACNRKRILIDLSHLNDKGFWDVAAISDAPLIATHSNAWNLCNSARNLTDRQLEAIRDSNGMVGINLATCFLRPDGSMTSNTDIGLVLQHIDYIIERVGDSRVGLGSDFDGAVVPKAIGDVAGLDALRDAFTQHGYDEALQAKLCHENWLNALHRVWGE